MNSIPKKAAVALPDFPNLNQFKVVDPENAYVPAFDRSFHFGDSVYEVTRSYDGVLFSYDEHIERLQKSAEKAGFTRFPSTELIHTQIKSACKYYSSKYGQTEVYVRITVSRGQSDLNIDPSLSSEPYALVFIKELEPPKPEAYKQGVHFAVTDIRRNLVQALDPAMKSGNYLNNILALAEAKKRGASDAILLNYQGFVTEGTTNNIFMVKNSSVLTAPLSVGILEGITRKWVFEAAKKLNLKIEERLFTEEELINADELFLSSSVKEIMPITKLNGVNVKDGAPGKTTQQLHSELKKIIESYTKTNISRNIFT